MAQLLCLRCFLIFAIFFFFFLFALFLLLGCVISICRHIKNQCVNIENHFLCIVFNYTQKVFGSDEVRYAETVFINMKLTLCTCVLVLQ